MKYDPLLRKLGIGVPSNWYNYACWFGNVAVFAFIKARFGWLALSAALLVAALTFLSMATIRMLDWDERGELDDEKDE